MVYSASFVCFIYCNSLCLIVKLSWILTVKDGAHEKYFASSLKLGLVELWPELTGLVLLILEWDLFVLIQILVTPVDIGNSSRW